MTKLTDLEICKRIAEIDGVEVNHQMLAHYNILVTAWCGAYNPLTDDALCFRLMVKYEVQLYAEDPEFNVAQCNSWAELYPRHSSVNRAICLAIIKGQ